MENDILCAKSVLHDLQKFATKENEISSLTTLNKIISSSQEEIDFLYNSDGIDIIMSFLETDNKLTNICLKILANASKRHEKVRRKLLENNILRLLALKLKNETDFYGSNLILYSALIVLVVQGDYEAQNRMHTSECLSSVLHILSCILDEEDSKPLPSKTTELLIYAIIASHKEPRHADNQTQVGRITPKILEYIGKQIIFFGSDQLHLVKCFWFLLKTALDGNEINQQIFLNSCGLSVLFRSIQCIVEEGNSEEMGDLLVKMTGVLVKFKSNREFLYQASNYCPVMILTSMLETRNILVIQHIINFLDCLTREFPRAFQIINGNDISRRMTKAKLFLLKSKMPIEVCQSFCNRMEIFNQTQASQTIHSLTPKIQFQFSLTNDDHNFGDTEKELDLQNHFCVVHDADLMNLQGDLEPSINPAIEARESKRQVEIPSKLRFAAGNLISSRKESKERHQKLRKIISQIFSRPDKDNTIRNTGRRIAQIFQRFLTFFIGHRTDFRKRLLQ